jgi:hypothetical protein
VVIAVELGDQVLLALRAFAGRSGWVAASGISRVRAPYPKSDLIPDREPVLFQHLAECHD